MPKIHTLVSAQPSAEKRMKYDDCDYRYPKAKFQHLQNIYEQMLQTAFDENDKEIYDNALSSLKSAISAGEFDNDYLYLRYNSGIYRRTDVKALTEECFLSVPFISIMSPEGFKDSIGNSGEARDIKKYLREKHKKRLRSFVLGHRETGACLKNDELIDDQHSCCSGRNYQKRLAYVNFFSHKDLRNKLAREKIKRIKLRRQEKANESEMKEVMGITETPIDQTVIPEFQAKLPGLVKEKAPILIPEIPSLESIENNTSEVCMPPIENLSISSSEDQEKEEMKKKLSEREKIKAERLKSLGFGVLI